MRNTTKANYKEWKDWKSKDFAQTSNRDMYYFQQLIAPLKLNNSANILEIGFGNGSFMGFARSNNYRISGIEIIPELLDRAKNNKFEVFNDISEIPTINTFDLIVMFDVLEHIDQDKIIKFLTNIKSYLSKNGYLIIRTPNGASPLGLSNQYGDTTHCTVVSNTKIGYWADCIGMSVKMQGGDLYPIYDGRISKIPTRIIRRSLHLIIERLVRWIFAPQSKGFLSSNLLAILKNDKK